jgi:hypothetical protein
MLYRWRTQRKKQHFYHLTRGILDTPPMPVRDAPWSIISMVSNSDVQMYLLAIKSFYARIERGKLLAIIDDDMPEASRDALRTHFPGIGFSILEDISTGLCQRGGTWERLIYVLNHSEKEYAIQLDCDTLTFGDISEAIDCIENNIPFTLGHRGEPIRTLQEAAAQAREINSDHIVIATQRLLDRYPQNGELKYVRGSSGFTGFAKRGFARLGIDEFHRELEGHLGARWKEWGTEQCGSNFAVANSPGAVVLPYPKYGSFEPNLERGKSTFLHFIGTYRYIDNYFASRAQDVIKTLMAT